MVITDEQLKAINEVRSGQDYFDKVAAMAVKGSIKKLPLNESPFVYQFEFGGSNGYWTGDHMIIQMEDCIDCLRVMFEDEYDFVFLFDHSSGHAKKRVGGLSSSSMNKGWGGEEMRPTMIIDGCLGPYHDQHNPNMVQIGQEQQLVYDKDADISDGPFNLTDDDREKFRYDTAIDLAPDKVGMKNKTRSELIADILDKGYQNDGTLNKMRVSELKKIAGSWGVDIQKHVASRTVHGWAGKGKGLLQVLWERGWIDVNKLDKYRMSGVVDGTGIVHNEFSLPHIMENCTDFANELSQLQHVCNELGVTAVTTTKYHAEYAGEGIEYSWGASKSLYRRQPLASKRSKASFDALVNKCISREQALPIELIRKFSRRARGYMEAYKSLEMKAELGKDNTISHVKIENMKKVLRCHRCALDFDQGFIAKILEGSDFHYKTEIEDGVMVKKENRRKRKKPL